MPTSATTRLGPPAAARRRHTYQDMARYAAPPTASPRPSASSLVITTPAPRPLRARSALTVTSRNRPQNVLRLAAGNPQRPGGRPSTVIPVGDEPNDPYDLARETAVRLAERTGVDRHDGLVVLGSGWPGAADALGEVVAELDVRELPGFLPPVA